MTSCSTFCPSTTAGAYGSEVFVGPITHNRGGDQVRGCLPTASSSAVRTEVVEGRCLVDEEFGVAILRGVQAVVHATVPSQPNSISKDATIRRTF